MKLLFCPDCHDMRRISNYLEEPTLCSCGKAHAQRKEDRNQLWWNGKGLILEVSDSDLACLSMERAHGEPRGDRFSWLRETSLYLVADGSVEIRP